VAEETFAFVASLPWLQQAIAHFYPDSTYAQNLDPGVMQLAAQRLFHPPATGAQVRCPHFGAPHPARSGMDEPIHFICSHCGESVTVEPPKIQ
jgi:hypothetical protein